MKKNVILITIDSLRADHLSCYGYQRKTSPNINKFAEKGILFKQAISNGGHTRIAFPTLFTSTYFFSHRFLKKTNDGFIIHLFDDRPYLPEILKKNGYKTAGFHSNPFLTERYGYGRGFDVLYDLFEKKVTKKESKLKSFVQNHLRHNGPTYKLIKFTYKLIKFTASKFISKAKEIGLPFARAEAITKNAFSWIKNNKNSAFFVWIHYMDVHHPYVPPEKHLIKFSDKTISQKEINILHNKMLNEPNSISNTDIKNLINLYDACINYVDYWIGKFLTALEAIGLLDNSLIILTADHGDSFGEHGEFGHGERSANLYDEIIRIPLIISAPNIRKGEIYDQVSLLDIAPTVLDFLSIQKPNSMWGESLLSRNLQKKNGVFVETLSVGAQAYININLSENVIKEESNLIRMKGVIAYRTKSWKYIYKMDGVHELYNLKIDPKERKNIVNEHVEKAEELKLRILQHLAIEEKIREKLKMRNKIRNKIKALKSRERI